MIKTIGHILLVFLASIPVHLMGQKIEGEIFSSEGPLEGVNILNSQTKEGTVSNAQGYFSLRAELGEILVFSFLGMKEVRLKVRDYEPIVIQMTEQYNKLDQATVLGRKKLPKNTFQKSETFHSFFGEQNLETAGYAISQVRGSEIVNSAAPEGIVPAYVKALEGKIAGYRVTAGGVVLRQSGSITQDNFALWEVDGQIFETWPPPPVDLSIIKDVFIIKSLAGVTKYGSRAAGGVIIVNTINNPAYRKKLENSKKVKAGLLYEEKKNINPYEGIKNEEDVDTKVSSLGNDINELRGLAYHCQTIGLQTKAAQIFRMILSLRQSDLQTLRDLAQTWSLASRAEKSWSAYMLAFDENTNMEDAGLGKVIYREMEKLYVSERLYNTIASEFELTSSFDDSDQNATRIVFEWSGSEHEFTIEVVNPEGQTYEIVFGSNYGNDKRIEEFFLDDSMKGKWLFNITQKKSGKEKNLHLKVSIYRNWYSTVKSPVNIASYVFSPDETNKYQLFDFYVR